MKHTFIGLLLFFAAVCCSAGQYAVVDGSGNVTNVIEWDGTASYTSPSGMTLVPTTTSGPGWTYANGIFTPPPAPALTPQQQFAAQVSQGVAVSCASGATVCTSAIAGTYSTPVPGSSAQQNITAISTAIGQGKVPGGGTTFLYLDAAGTPHTFTAAQWGEFDTAMLNYSYALQIALATALAGGSATWPSNSVQLQ